MTNVGAWHIRHNYGTNLWVDSLELVKHSTRVTSLRLSSEVRRCNSTSGLCSKLHLTVHCSNCLGKVNAVSRSPPPLLWRALATVKSLGWWRLRAARCSGFWVMVAEKRSFWRGEVRATTERGEGEALNCLVIYRFRKIILFKGEHYHELYSLRSTHDEILSHTHLYTFFSLRNAHFLPCNPQKFSPSKILCYNYGIHTT